MWIYFQNNLNHWCKPDDSEVNPDGDMLSVKEHLKPVVLQCPYSLTKSKYMTMLTVSVYILPNHIVILIVSLKVSI